MCLGTTLEKGFKHFTYVQSTRPTNTHRLSLNSLTSLSFGKNDSGFSELKSSVLPMEAQLGSDTLPYTTSIEYM